MFGVSQSELAYFGGWKRIQTTDGMSWGDPSWRNVEFYNEANLTNHNVALPDHAIMQPGLIYMAYSSPDSIGPVTITASSISCGDITLAAGEAVELMNTSSGWIPADAGNTLSTQSINTAAILTPDVGTMQNAVEYEVNITRNVSNFNVMQHVESTFGYDGSFPITVRVNVKSGVAVGSVSRLIPGRQSTQHAGEVNYAMTTGFSSDTEWPDGSLFVLNIDEGGLVGGWGGKGGVSKAFVATIADTPYGEDGGPALFCGLPTNITCYGSIIGGGGGGTSGRQGGLSPLVAHPQGGSGGGGAGANMSNDAASRIVGSLSGETVGRGPWTGTTYSGGLGREGLLESLDPGIHSGSGGNGGGPGEDGSAGAAGYNETEAVVNGGAGEIIPARVPSGGPTGYQSRGGNAIEKDSRIFGLPVTVVEGLSNITHQTIVSV
jgi:hypothetical protein